jgi:hypothetical protein
MATKIALCGVNGRRLTMTNDEAYELVMAVAEGRLDDIATITTRLGPATQRRPCPIPPHGRRTSSRPNRTVVGLSPSEYSYVMIRPCTVGMRRSGL